MNLIPKKTPVFDIQQTTVLKGIGILMILFHNYLIFQPNSKFYNQEKFEFLNFNTFIHEFWPISWHESFSSILIFFGHYGVQLFIFCTAYGLAKVYENKALTYYQNDLKKRLNKILILISLGLITFLAYIYLCYGKIYPSSLFIKNLILLLSTAGTFNKDWLYSMFTGPFWYFGLTLQLYLLFPYLYRIFEKWGIFISIFVSYLIIYPLYYIDSQSKFTVFGNLIGHLPEVFFAFFLAKKGLTTLNPLLFILTLLLFPVTQYSIYLYPLSFLCILIFLLSVYKFSLGKLPKLAYDNLLYIGEISMIIFILNGFLRFSPFVNIQNSSLRAERVFLYAILIIFISHWIHKIYISILKYYNLR